MTGFFFSFIGFSALNPMNEKKTRQVILPGLFSNGAVDAIRTHTGRPTAA